MRSIQITHLEKIGAIKPHNARWYSDLCVLNSPAGWYVGTIYENVEGKVLEPGSRDTDYFEHKKHAEFALFVLERLSAYHNTEELIIQKYELVMNALLLNPRDVGYRIEP